MNDFILQEFQRYQSVYDFSDDFANSKFFITGATGLIGSMLCRYLIATTPGLQIYAPVRSLKKAMSLFSGTEIRHIRFIEESEIGQADYLAIAADSNYIIHCAAPTASRYFVEHPVETSAAIFNGTNAILNFARQCSTLKSCVYLSSLEVYGENLDETKIITEDFQGYVDVGDIRSCYPLAKRLAENLCVSYFREYGVPVRIARLTQVSGVGVAANDRRILADFCFRKAKGRPIVLHTAGASARPYLYTLDAISGILTLLRSGINGEAYNLSNDSTYISAYALGTKIAQKAPATKFEVNITPQTCYPSDTFMNLSSEKLRALGWQCLTDLDHIIDIIIKSANDSTRS